MRNSNTSLDSRRAKHWLFGWGITALALVCFASAAYPIDPLRIFSRYMREHWGIENGFPGGSVSAIAQTTDGYLWIGTEKGLVRFDGQNFRLFRQAIPGPSPVAAVKGLQGDAEGNLWILLDNAKILRFHEGKLELGREETEFAVTAIGRGKNDSVLFASLALGVLTFQNGRFESIASPSGELPKWEANAPDRINDSKAPSSASNLASPCRGCSHAFSGTNSAITSMAETADGKVWLGTRDMGLFYMIQGGAFAAGKGWNNTKITALLSGGNGELWIGTNQGMLKWNGVEASVAGVPSALRHVPILAMIRDHDSNLWVGTARGLARVAGDQLSIVRGSGTTGPVTALFEDRERNLWVGGPRGIERLRSSTFVTYLGDWQPETSGPVFIDQQGRAWFASARGGLDWLQGEKYGHVADHRLDQGVTYSIAGSSKELWIGRQRSGLTRLTYTRGAPTIRSYTEADGLAQNSVYVVYQSRDGTVWAGTLTGGVSRFDGRRFMNYTTANGLASNTVTAILETRDGSIWFGTSNGLNSLSSGRWRTYTTKDGLPSEEVNCLFEDSSGTLWAGTSDGLAFFRSGHVQVPRNLPASLRGKIFGMAEDKLGWFWMATADHVLRAERDKIASGTLGVSDLREYGVQDGLRSTEGIKRSRPVVADSSGKIWFSLSRGLSVVDPARVADTSAPAIPQIEALSADGNPINLLNSVHIPPSPKRITLTFTGLSLAVPERVRFRYFLENFDRGWSAPVQTREAVYTNLAAGSYCFRVVASNSEGQWNGPESALRFVIEPRFWETGWFRATCVPLLLFLVWCAHRYRLYQLTRQFNMRFEERVSERTRIARDLHDTLLQSFHGLLLRFQAVSNLLPARPQEAKARLDDAIDQAAQAITEGRDAVQGLRASATAPNDLALSLSALGRELGSGEMSQHSPEFQVEVEGAPRELHAILRDEVYRIAGEALRNAFRHAQARRIELEVHYDECQLRLRIRDDGRGMETQLVDGVGRPGHWGLRGMRERAKVIGGNLELWSEFESGTEVELTIPASTAYTAATPPRRFWFSSKRAATHE